MDSWIVHLINVSVLIVSRSVNEDIWIDGVT